MLELHKGTKSYALEVLVELQYSTSKSIGPKSKERHRSHERIPPAFRSREPVKTKQMYRGSERSEYEQQPRPWTLSCNLETLGMIAYVRFDHRVANYKYLLGTT